MANYLTINSNKYRKGMKWAQVPENVIDTVVLNPIANNILENEVVAEDDITNVETLGALPIGPVVGVNHLTYTNFSYAYEESWGGDLCSARVGVTMAIIRKRFTLTDPVIGTPTVKITLSGTTTQVGRGSKTFFGVPGRSDTWGTVVNYITNNADSTDEWVGDSSIKPYSEGAIDVIPWLKKYRLNNHDYPENVITAWHGQCTASSWNPNYKQWNAYDTYDAMEIAPPVYYPRQTTHIPDDLSGQAIIKVPRVAISSNITRIDSRTFDVIATVPVFFIYCAASRFGGEYDRYRLDIDNWSAYDRVTSVNIQLISNVINKSKSSISYSLDNSGNLTTEVKNKYPFNFKDNNFITANATYGESNWIQKMTKLILTEYKEGKYVIEFDVDAAWAIENDIKVNKPLMVRNIFNNYIQKNNRVCVFEVKTIEKKYENGNFIYSIRALESSKSWVDIQNVGLVYNITRIDSNMVLGRYDYLYLDASTRTLKKTTDQNVVKTSKVLGNGIALTSTNTIVGDFIVLPGDLIGHKVVIIAKATGTVTSEEFNTQAGFYNYNPETGVEGWSAQQNVYHRYVEAKSAHYFVYVIDTTSFNYNLRMYIRGTIGDNTVINSVQIYNANNVPLTGEEALDWLIEHNKLI